MIEAAKQDNNKVPRGNVNEQRLQQKNSKNGRYTGG